MILRVGIQDVADGDKRSLIGRLRREQVKFDQFLTKLVERVSCATGCGKMEIADIASLAHWP